MRETFGLVLIWSGIVFIAMGVFGVYRFKNFYPRTLVVSKIDTVGNITLMAGIALRSGFNFFTMKVLLILSIMLIINPLSTHSIARSAYYSGYKVRKD